RRHTSRGQLAQGQQGPARTPHLSGRLFGAAAARTLRVLPIGVTSTVIEDGSCPLASFWVRRDNRVCEHAQKRCFAFRIQGAPGKHRVASSSVRYAIYSFRRKQFWKGPG